MRWFQGSIVEAVAASRAKNSLFCVFILGSDEVSQELQVSLESAEVQTTITKEDMVCIKIDAESEDLQHFTRIYTNAKSPSIFCISQGIPVETIFTGLNTSDLNNRFQVAINRHREGIASASTKLTSSQSQPTVISETTSPSTPTEAPLENRIERARLLAATKQQKKAEEEAEEEKKREIERRQVGQKVAELKRWQAEQEIKKLAEERRKDKEQETKLRQRLRDQIAQDRIDRQARLDMSSGVASTSPAGTTTDNSVPIKKMNTNYSGQARLQFRLPDGSSQNQTFEPDSTLGQVRQYLVDNVVPYRDFTIWVAFPRREFTNTDYATTLRELGLLPASALLIIPVTGQSIVKNAGQAGQGLITFVSTFVGYMLYPFTFILTLLQRALPTPSPQNNSSPQETKSNVDIRNIPRNRNTLDDMSSSAPTSSMSFTQSTKKPETGPSTSGESRSKATGAQGKKTTEKGTVEGNVHRLRTSESDSDDEQATWNGNSTQQM